MLTKRKEEISICRYDYRSHSHCCRCLHSCDDMHSHPKRCSKIRSMSCSSLVRL